MLLRTLERSKFLLLILWLASKHIRNKAMRNQHVIPSRLRVMKLVFLIQKEAPKIVKRILGSTPYTFTPYLHGPFSKEVLDDLDKLHREGFIEISIEPLDIYGYAIQYTFTITKKGEKTIRELMRKVPEEALEELEYLIKKYASKPLRKLLDYVYTTYPEDSIPDLE